MSYRRSSSIDVESPRWRLKHRGFLAECGLPPEVVNSDRTWIYVLLHGGDELGTGWDPTWITNEQAEKLLRFLESEVESEVGFHLLGRLRQRIEE
jgi:hypothetical protein